MSKNHDWRILFAFKNEDNHLFGQFFCANCNMSGFCTVLTANSNMMVFPDYQGFTCGEFSNIYEKSITHDWKKIDKPRGNYVCETCNLEGFLDDYDNTPWIKPLFKNYYTCNEWLMIKANE